MPEHSSDTPTCELLIIGEAPGAQEVMAGKPFIGKSGELLRALLKKAGIEATTHITNACLCRPTGNETPDKDQIGACNARLLAEIHDVQPKLILALGATSLKALGINAKNMTAVRGSTITVTIHGETYTVLPSWHPAYVLRNPDAVRDLFADLLTAKALLDGDTPEEFKEPQYVMVERLPEKPEGNPLVFVDFETTNVLHPWQGRIYLTGIMFEDEPTIVYIMPGENPNLLPNYRYVAHNAMFEYKWIKAKLGFTPHMEADTMLMHFCIKETPPHDLKSLGVHYLHLSQSWSINAAKITSYPIREAAQYLAWDVAVTRALYHLFNESDAVHAVHYPLLMDALPLLTDMHLKGVPADSLYLMDLEGKLEDEIVRHVQTFVEVSGQNINVNSPKQLAHALYIELGLPTIRGFSTDEECLKALLGQHPCIESLLEIRKLEKLRGTYAKGLQKAAAWDGLIHTTFTQSVATTGRLSSRDPNLQNIPRGPLVRNAFMAPEGHYFIEADYAQLEFRIAAHYSDDPNLIQYIQDGRDVHKEVATVIYKKDAKDITKAERHFAKNSVVFASLYLKKPASIAQELGISVEEVQTWFDFLWGNFPKLKQWIEDTCAFVVGDKENAANHYVQHDNGRVRRFPLLTRENRNEVMRQAVNSPLQGLASDICLTSAIKIDQKYGSHIDIRLLVHDAINSFIKIEDAETYIPLKKAEMESPIYKLRVPLEVDIKVSDRWEGTPIEIGA